MHETLSAAAETLVALAIWTVFAGAVLRYLTIEWLRARQEFERETLAKLAAVAQQINDNRREAETARGMLRQEYTEEDALLRERSHDLAGKIGVVMADLANTKNDVLALIEANEKMVATAGAKFDHLTDHLHKLNLAIVALNTTLKRNGQAHDG